MAAAVIEFITGPLLESPKQVGGVLRNELQGLRSARRGAYRILYRIDEARGAIIVVRVGHRRDVYRFS